MRPGVKVGVFCFLFRFGIFFFSFFFSGVFLGTPGYQDRRRWDNCVLLKADSSAHLLRLYKRG